ncbi:MAG: tetratricopeptide repeat protein [Fusobacteriaceae bacterium]
MRKKTFIIGCYFALSLCLIAGEKEDINSLNQVYSQNNYNVAISESKKFLTKYPSSKNLARIEERMAKTYYIQKKYEDGIKSFKNILQKYPLQAEKRNEMNYYISKSYFLLEEKEDFSKYVSRIDKSSQYYERAFYDKGVIQLDRGEYEEAFKTFQEIAINGKDFKNASTFNMALVAYNDELFSMVVDVLDNYSKILDKNKDDSAIAYLYGSSFYKLNNIPKAIYYFELLSTKYPDTPYGKKARITLIEIYANRNNMEMVNKYSSLVKGTQEEIEALVTLGDFYVSRNSYVKAIDYYKQVGIETNNRALYGYAYSLYRMNKIKEGLPYFKKLEKTSYYNQAIYYKFASLYRLKNYNEIIKEREEAKKIVVTQQDNDNINIIIANSAYELKNYSLAKDYYSRLNLHTPSKENLFRVITMSGILNEAQDVENRIADYKRLYPNDKEYKKRIYIAAGESLYTNGKKDIAEKLYKEYLKDDNDIDIVNSLNSLLVNEKKYSELNSYLSTQAETIDVLYLKAISLTGIGNYTSSEELYARILTLIKNDNSNEWYNKTKLNQIKNYFLSGQYETTIKEGEIYLTLEGAQEIEDIQEKIALSYFRTKNYEKSREYFTKAQINPEKSDEVKFQIADSYYAEKNYSKSKEIYYEVYNSSVNEKNREIALYSIGKIAATVNDVAGFKKISSEFLAKYPESSFKENLLSNYSQVAESIKGDNEIIKTYTIIYNSTSEEYVKQNALEKIVEGNINSKKYVVAEKEALKITDKIKQSVFLAQIYEKQGAITKASKEYEKLMNAPQHREYAVVNLAKYWYTKKNYNKSKEYYTMVLNLSSPTYKDLALFQIANIDENSKKIDSAIKGYKRVYTEYKKSPFVEDSRLKAAQLNEVKNINEALKIYDNIYKVSSNKRYKIFSLEKLVYYNLKSKKTVIAKKYYDILNSMDKKSADKYSDFFKEEAKK